MGRNLQQSAMAKWQKVRPKLTFWKLGHMCKTTDEIQCKLMQIDV